MLCHHWQNLETTQILWVMILRPWIKRLLNIFLRRRMMDILQNGGLERTYRVMRSCNNEFHHESRHSHLILDMRQTYVLIISKNQFHYEVSYIIHHVEIHQKSPSCLSASKQYWYIMISYMRPFLGSVQSRIHAEKIRSNHAITLKEMASHAITQPPGGLLICGHVTVT